ncbi:MAG: hypothetical protein ACJASV_000272 [Pseudorhodobacter sp.]|jgi:hypothetical protein
MNRLILICLGVTLAACTNPGLYAGIGIGPNGVSVRPVATANVGGATVSVSP